MTDRGDRNRTCDLVPQKQWVAQVITTRTTQVVNSESVDTGKNLQVKIDN